MPHGRGLEVDLNLNEFAWGHFNNGFHNGPFFRITTEGELQTADFDNSVRKSDWVTVDSTEQEPVEEAVEESVEEPVEEPTNSE